MTNFILFLLIFGLCFFVYWRVRKNFKVLNVPSVCLVTGGVKTGKSKLCVQLSLKEFKRVHRRWFISKWLCKLLRRRFDTEEPLYYTNCAISFGNLKDYAPRKKSRIKFFNKKPHRLDRCIRKVTLESLLRDERFNYKSVIYIQEASLMADNMDYNNIDRNVELSLFAKLIAHETRGGKLFLDTQSILDVHYSFKRVSSTYLFIQKRLDFFLFDVLYVREMINMENGNNNFIDDVDYSTRKIIVPRWYNHKYDRYEFSYLTDDLARSDSDFVAKSGLVSFNPRYRKHADKRVKEEK